MVLRVEKACLWSSEYLILQRLHVRTQSEINISMGASMVHVAQHCRHHREHFSCTDRQTDRHCTCVEHTSPVPSRWRLKSLSVILLWPCLRTYIHPQSNWFILFVPECSVGNRKTIHSTPTRVESGHKWDWAWVGCCALQIESAKLDTLFLNCTRVRVKLLR